MKDKIDISSIQKN